MTLISSLGNSFVGGLTSRPKRNKAIYTHHVKKGFYAIKVILMPIFTLVRFDWNVKLICVQRNECTYLHINVRIGFSKCYGYLLASWQWHSWTPRHFFPIGKSTHKKLGRCALVTLESGKRHVTKIRTIKPHSKNWPSLCESGGVYLQFVNQNICIKLFRIDK